jgi:hypothetical protein
MLTNWISPEALKSLNDGFVVGCRPGFGWN